MMPSTRFLASLSRDSGTRHDFSDTGHLLVLLGRRVGGVLQDLARQSRAEPWSACNMTCVRLTRAFIDHHVATCFVQRIDALQSRDELPASSLAVLGKLAHVFILDALRSNMADLAESEILDAAGLRALREAATRAIDALDDDLVGLTDAFQFSDWELNSVLGRYDGNVYAELWRTVNEDNPINTNRREGVVRAFDTLIRPLHETARGTVQSKL